MTVYGANQMMVQRTLAAKNIGDAKKSFMMMGLIGLIVASIVNIFLQSSAMHWVISIAGVGIFVGLTAYDTQKLKHMALTQPAGMDAGVVNSVARMVKGPVRGVVAPVELTAVASRTLDKARKLAETFGCEAVEGYDNLLERRAILIIGNISIISIIIRKENVYGYITSLRMI